MIVCFEVILHMYNNIILVLVVNRFDYILFLLELAGCCHNNFQIHEQSLTRCQEPTVSETATHNMQCS